MRVGQIITHTKKHIQWKKEHYNDHRLYGPDPYIDYDSRRLYTEETLPDKFEIISIPSIKTYSTSPHEKWDGAHFVYDGTVDTWENPTHIEIKEIPKERDRRITLLTSLGVKLYCKLFKHNYWIGVRKIGDFNHGKWCCIQCPECGQIRSLTTSQLNKYALLNKFPHCKCGHPFSCIYDESYHLNFDIKFRKQIKKRDHYACQICHSKENLCVHHIHYDKSNDCSDPRDFLTVCCSCNTALNSNRDKQILRCEKIIERIYSKRTVLV